MLTKQLRILILDDRLPSMGPVLSRIYQRADWPPPNCDYERTFIGVWSIKNPSLRATRLKVLYKDIFSNERRHRFGLADSSACLVCGQIETVEHHLWSCNNAKRIWLLFQRLTGTSIGSLFDVVRCDLSIELEIIKSVLMKALLQIDRSANTIERALKHECSFFLKVEAAVNQRKAVSLRRLAEQLDGLP